MQKGTEEAIVAKNLANEKLLKKMLAMEKEFGSDWLAVAMAQQGGAPAPKKKRVEKEKKSEKKKKKSQEGKKEKKKKMSKQEEFAKELFGSLKSSQEKPVEEETSDEKKDEDPEKKERVVSVAVNKRGRVLKRGSVFTKREKRQERLEGLNRFEFFPNEVLHQMMRTGGYLDPVTASMLARTCKLLNRNVLASKDYTLPITLSAIKKTKILLSFVKDAAKSGKSKFFSFLKNSLKVIGPGKHPRFFSEYFSRAAKEGHLALLKVMTGFRTKLSRSSPSANDDEKEAGDGKKTKRGWKHVDEEKQKMLIRDIMKVSDPPGGSSVSNVRVYSGEILFPFPCWPKSDDSKICGNNDKTPHWSFKKRAEKKRVERGGTKNPVYCLPLIYGAASNGKDKVVKWLLDLIVSFYEDKKKHKISTTWKGYQTTGRGKKLYLTDLTDIICYQNLKSVVTRLCSHALGHSYEYFKQMQHQRFENVSPIENDVCDVAVRKGNLDAVVNFQTMIDRSHCNMPEIQSRVKQVCFYHKSKEPGLLTPLRERFVVHVPGFETLSRYVLLAAARKKNTEALLWAHEKGFLKPIFWDYLGEEMTEHHKDWHSYVERSMNPRNAAQVNKYENQIDKEWKRMKALQSVLEYFMELDWYRKTKMQEEEKEGEEEENPIVNGDSSKLFRAYLQMAPLDKVTLWLERGTFHPDPKDANAWDKTDKSGMDGYSQYNLLKGNYYAPIPWKTYALLTDKGLVVKNNVMGRIVAEFWSNLPSLLILDGSVTVKYRDGDIVLSAPFLNAMRDLVGDDDYKKGHELISQLKIRQLKERVRPALNETLEKLKEANVKYGCVPDVKCLMLGVFIDVPELSEALYAMVDAKSLHDAAGTALSKAAYMRGSVRWLEWLKKLNCHHAQFDDMNVSFLGHLECLEFLMDNAPRELIGRQIGYKRTVL
jgi:hypothetical protein